MKIVKLIASVLICLFIGFLGSFFTTPSIPGWYASLEKPPFNPPNWVFAPVWTILYVLMGISLYLIWDRGFDNKEVKSAVFVFGFQLLLNLLWSILFFGLKSPLFALLEIIVLWLFILLTIIKFNNISKRAASLLLPYIFWVSFAAILNFFIVKLNNLST